MATAVPLDDSLTMRLLPPSATYRKPDESTPRPLAPLKGTEGVKLCTWPAVVTLKILSPLLLM